jgi:hypothetical protein
VGRLGGGVRAGAASARKRGEGRKTRGAGPQAQTSTPHTARTWSWRCEEEPGRGLVVCVCVDARSHSVCARAKNCASVFFRFATAVAARTRAIFRCRARARPGRENKRERERPSSSPARTHALRGLRTSPLPIHAHLRPLLAPRQRAAMGNGREEEDYPGAFFVFLFLFFRVGATKEPMRLVFALSVVPPTPSCTRFSRRPSYRMHALMERHTRHAESVTETRPSAGGGVLFRSLLSGPHRRSPRQNTPPLTYTPSLPTLPPPCQQQTRWRSAWSTRSTRSGRRTRRSCMVRHGSGGGVRLGALDAQGEEIDRAALPHPSALSLTLSKTPITPLPQTWSSRTPWSGLP